MTTTCPRCDDRPGGCAVCAVIPCTPHSVAPARPPLLDTGTAARHHALDTAPQRALDAVLHVSVYTDPRTRRNRPFCVTVKVGRNVRVHRFADEAQRDLYAAQARDDLALLAEHLSDDDLPRGYRGMEAQR